MWMHGMLLPLKHSWHQPLLGLWNMQGEAEWWDACVFDSSVIPLNIARLRFQVSGACVCLCKSFPAVLMWTLALFAKCTVGNTGELVLHSVRRSICSLSVVQVWTKVYWARHCHLTFFMCCLIGIVCVLVGYASAVCYGQPIFLHLW